MKDALANFLEWHAEHFGDFSPEVNAQLLCLANDATSALAASENGCKDAGHDITTEWMDDWADDIGVQRFAKAMKAKLAEKRLQGYSGWNNDCTVVHLEALLSEHVNKPWAPRNLVDIANFCMMLWNRHRPLGEVPTSAERGQSK